MLFISIFTEISNNLYHKSLFKKYFCRFFFHKKDLLCCYNWNMMKTHINVISGSLKKKEWAEIVINGKTGLPNMATRRGINLLVLNSELTPINFRFYDFNKSDVNQVFMDNINAIPDQSIIILCVKGDGCKRMEPETRQFINTKLKSRFIMDLKKNQAWCCIIKKYDNLYKNIVEKADITIVIFIVYKNKILLRNFCKPYPTITPKSAIAKNI